VRVPAADARQVTLLGLLDMSAAFDFVDHSVLLHDLSLYLFGAMALPSLQWRTSFLTDRTQRITLSADIISAATTVIRRPTGLGAWPVTLQHLYSRYQ